MTISLSQKLKSFFSKKTSKKQCIDEKNCIKLLELILDGEGTEEEQKFFEQHIEKCMYCYENYNLDKTIREALKTKLEKKPVPIDLINDIRIKIQQTAI